MTQRTMKNIKNYTSSVPASQSISKMERLLIDAGARNILKNYGDGQTCIGLAFDLPYKDPDSPLTVTLQFKFAVDVKAVFQAILDNQRRSRVLSRSAKESLMAQAERTAWKLELDSLEINLARISIQTAKLPQILLGYMYNYATDKTMYDMVKEGGFKMIGDGR
jgi:hypothetical protein